jgi:hypothetical protein
MTAFVLGAHLACLEATARDLSAFFTRCKVMAVERWQDGTALSLEAYPGLNV